MVGETFGNYEVVATLGKGGVGVVYLAQHHTIARRAAIKVLAPELSKDRDVVKRFFLEALATSLIRHPGIVEVFDYDVEPSGRAYIVMEYLEGETLGECLERSGSLPWQTACAIAQRIASAVGAAHGHGVVHRDLKPGNVFVSRVVGSFDVTERRIKVLDFGLAKLLSDDRGTERITRAGMLLGTPMYISPEQCTGADQATHSADIYALGCILFEMITGRPPFERDGIRAILAAHMFEAPPRLPDVPAWLEELILRMLAKKPGGAAGVDGRGGGDAGDGGPRGRWPDLADAGQRDRDVARRGATHAAASSISVASRAAVAAALAHRAAPAFVPHRAALASLADRAALASVPHRAKSAALASRAPAAVDHRASRAGCRRRCRWVGRAGRDRRVRVFARRTPTTTRGRLAGGSHGARRRRAGDGQDRRLRFAEARRFGWYDRAGRRGTRTRDADASNPGALS